MVQLLEFDLTYPDLILILAYLSLHLKLRFLDTAGMKKSTLYLMNGIMMLFSWMLVRILLFIYVFYHEYFHFDQVAFSSGYQINSNTSCMVLKTSRK